MNNNREIVCMYVPVLTKRSETEIENPQSN